MTFSPAHAYGESCPGLEQCIQRAGLPDFYGLGDVPQGSVTRNGLSSGLSLGGFQTCQDPYPPGFRAWAVALAP